MVEQVPGPHGLPFLGNLRDLADEEAPLRALERMAELYGPIYKLQLGKGTTYVVSSVAMAEELCDESRYQKAPPAALSSGKSDPARPYGLFAARNDDPDWGQAHRILMPAFGPMAIEGLYDGTFNDLRSGVNVLIQWVGRNERHRRSTLLEMGPHGICYTNLCYRRLYKIDPRYDCALHNGFSF